MKRLKRIVSVVLALAIAVTTFAFPASAATVEWTGKTKLKSGNTYTITKKIGITKELVIPANTKLSVRKGGELIFYKGSKITVNGNLSTSIGGKISNSGDMTIGSKGQLNVYGDFASSISAKIKNAGKITVYNKGKFATSSTVQNFKGAKISTTGEINFLKSSSLTNSSNITAEKGGKVHFNGTTGVSVSGTILINGYMTIGASGTIKNSGKVIVSKNAGYNRFGRLVNTKSGVFEDKRSDFEFDEQTVSILVDEPVVESRGIDVSFWQGQIDWAKVANAGVDFAIIRAGRGDTGSKPIAMDTEFENNIRGATANGIDCGVYFYTYATTVEEAIKEAEFLVSIIDSYELTYPVVLDIEEEMHSNLSKEELTAIIDAFFMVIMKAGYFPMLNSYKNWLESNLDMTILDKYAVWLAEYKEAPTYEGAYYIWQYSAKGKISGIKGDVDLNISYRDFPSILRKHGLNKLK